MSPPAAIRQSLWGWMGYVVLGVLALSRYAASTSAYRSNSKADVVHSVRAPSQNYPSDTSQSSPTVELGWWPLISQAGTQWVSHKDARLGAALAYYSVFSIGPLIVIAIAVAGLLFGQDAVRGQVTDTLKGLLGDTGAQAINAMLVDASKPREGILAAAIGLGTLVFAAVGVVVQLKDALNTVWEVKTESGGSIWTFVRTYILSFAGVISLGFLLLVSMLVTTALAAGGKYIALYLPETVLQLAGFVISFLVIVLLFAMMFKWLPDTQVRWRDVWLGAVVTALLFEIGKFLIGIYIGKQGLESTYGAAASIVIVLIWVYYSAQIVLFGAEFTNVCAKQHDTDINAFKQSQRTAAAH
jgi:membrane protein